MPVRQFEQFLQHVSSLTRRQRDRLLALLQSAAGLDRARDLIDHPGTTPSCPRCQADCPYRHGHANGLQRYRCRLCARTFNALSGTPLPRLRHKSRWRDYLDGMLFLLPPASPVRRRLCRHGPEDTCSKRATSSPWRPAPGACANRWPVPVTACCGAPTRPAAACPPS
ncbi:transposase [Massilia sp. LXY-6]|uniref:transposase n=1 Tax=Massilia sp. LXY-6 TaxID=3379823 RepID=UPI003F49D38A